MPGVSADNHAPRVLSAELDLSRVLVPLDGFPAAEYALAYANVFANCFGSNLLLFHVLPPAHPVHQVRGAPVRFPYALRDRGAILANSYLQEVAARLQPLGTNAQWSVATGNTAELIGMRAVIGGFGLIVLAVNPHGATRRKPKAALAVQLWKRTAVPVLLVNARVGSTNDAPPEQPERILVPLHPREQGREALDMAEAIASRSGAPVTIVCSRPPRGETPWHIEAHANRMLELGLDVDIHTSSESIRPTLDRLQDEHRGSWIVIRSKMGSGFSTPFRTSVTDQVVRYARAPVLAIPEESIAKKRAEKLRALNPEVLGLRTAR